MTRANKAAWDKKCDDSVLMNVRAPWGEHYTVDVWAGMPVRLSTPLTYDEWWLKQQLRWKSFGDLASPPEGLDDTPMHFLVMGALR